MNVLIRANISFDFTIRSRRLRIAFVFLQKTNVKLKKSKFCLQTVPLLLAPCSMLLALRFSPRTQLFVPLRIHDFVVKLEVLEEII